VQLAGVAQLLTERVSQRVGEHRDAVFVALAVAHGNLSALEVEVFYAQPKLLRAAEALR
jgi:hypothetical protein